VDAAVDPGVRDFNRLAVVHGRPRNVIIETQPTRSRLSRQWVEYSAWTRMIAALASTYLRPQLARLSSKGHRDFSRHPMLLLFSANQRSLDRPTLGRVK